MMDVKKIKDTKDGQDVKGLVKAEMERTELEKAELEKYASRAQRMIGR